MKENIATIQERNRISWNSSQGEHEKKRKPTKTTSEKGRDI